MGLNVTKRNNKEYLYFTANDSERLYLGTSAQPQKEKILEAVRHLEGKVRKYQAQMEELETLFYKDNPKYEMEKTKYRLVVFDLDGVIFEKPFYGLGGSDKVAVSTWDVLFQELGIYEFHEKLRKNFEDGILKTYMEWTEAACNILKSWRLDEGTFQKVIRQRPFMLGAKDVFRVLREQKIITAVISGSFSELGQRAKSELGDIDYIFAHCKLRFNESNGLLESWELQPTDYQDKALFVEKIAKDNGINEDECAFVGDDVNDIFAFKKAGLSIAFNSNKLRVNQSAHVVIESRNLKSVLQYLSTMQPISLKERARATPPHIKKQSKAGTSAVLP